MQNAFIITGRITGQNLITLDEKIPIKSDRVRVILEPLENVQTTGIRSIISCLRERQENRGYIPAKKNKVDEYIKKERESW